MLPMPSTLTRRGLLAGAAAGIFSGCSRTKGSGYFGYALIANHGDKSVSAVDLTAFRLAGAIPFRAAPAAVVPAGADALAASRLAYVLTPADGSVHLVDANLTAAAAERLSDQVNEIRLTPDRRSLLAVSEAAQELIQADAVTLRRIARHKLGFAPTALDVSAAGYAAVAGGREGEVALIQLATGRRAQTKMPPPLGAIRFRGDGKMLLVANLQGRSILALNVPDLQIVAELPLAMRPEHLCFNADQGQLFVSGAGMDGVAVVFPYNTLEVDQTLLAGPAPGPMACSETPAYLFVASTAGSSICVLNVDTRKQLGLVEVGGTPTFVTTTPDSQYALILNKASGDMAVVHIPAIRTTSSANRLKNGTALFTMLNVGSEPVHAAIVARRS